MKMKVSIDFMKGGSTIQDFRQVFEILIRMGVPFEVKENNRMVDSRNSKEFEEFLLNALSNSRDVFEYCSILVRYSGTPESVVSQINSYMSSDFYQVELNSYLDVSNANEEELREYVNSFYYKTREKIAKLEILPEDVVRKLAKDRNHEIRIITAERNDLPSDCFYDLCMDDNPKVRSAALFNENCPKEVFWDIVKDERNYQTGNIVVGVIKPIIINGKDDEELMKFLRSRTSGPNGKTVEFLLCKYKN